MRYPGLEALDPNAGFREPQEQLRQFEQKRGRIASRAGQQAQVSSAASSEPAAPAPDATTTRPAPVRSQPAASTTTSGRYSPEVEAWRSEVSKYDWDVGKVLHVLTFESGGNPNAVGDGGAAIGGFQNHHIPAGLSMAEQVREAYKLYQQDRANGGTGFGDWGEGRLYQGQPFGAHGRHPYGFTSTAAAERPPASAETAEPPRAHMASMLKEDEVTSRAFAGDVDPRSILARFEPEPELQRRMEPYVDALSPDVAERLLSRYAIEKQQRSPNAAFQSFIREVQVEAIIEELEARDDVETPEAQQFPSLSPEEKRRVAEAYIEHTGSFEEAAKLIAKKGRQPTWETALIETLATAPIPVLGRGLMSTRAFLAGSGAAYAGANVAGDVAEDLGAPGLVQTAARTLGSTVAFGLGARASAIGDAAGRGIRGQVANMVADAPEPPTAAGRAADAAAGTPTPIQRLAAIVREAKKLPEESEALRSQQRSQRAAAANRVLQGSGSATERARNARNMLFQRGEMDRAEFEAPAVKLSADDIEELNSRLLTSGLREYEVGSAVDALDKVLEGRFNQIQPNEFALLDRVFGPELTSAVVRQQGINWLDEMMAILALPQTLGTSFDLSAPGRQGAVLGFSNPRAWAESWDPMMKAGIGEGMARNIDGKLREMDWVTGHSGDAAKDALAFTKVGGHLSELSQFSGEASGEAARAFVAGSGRSRVMEVARGFAPVRASERAYNTYLNQLRGRVYAREAERMWRGGVRDPKQYEALASVINHASGWSEHSIGQLQSGRAGINVFFSPRLTLSRFQTALDPILQPGSLFRPSARQLAAKNLVAMVAGEAGLITTIAALTGADLSWNPVDTDFGKLVYGNTRVDLLAGFSPLIRTVARLSSAAGEAAGIGEGEAISSGGGGFDIDIKDEIIRYFRNKESPFFSLITDVVLGETAIGEDAPASPEYIAQRFAEGMVPFFLRDVAHSLREDGARGVVSNTPSFFGAGVLNYPPTAGTDRRNLRDEAAERIFGKPYDELRPTQQARVNRESEVMEADTRVQEDYKDTPYGQYRAAKDKVYGDLQRTQDMKERAFERGVLDKKITEWWQDLGHQRRGASAALQETFKKTLESFEQDEFDTAIDGYYGTEVIDPDNGSILWDDTEAARLRYMRDLPAHQREWLTDFLNLQEQNQSPLRRQYLEYLESKEEAGYFREGITQAEREALDAANPGLDVDGWYWGGGVKEGNTPALQTAAAVEMALAMELPNRPVKLAGFARAVNADEKTTEAWRYGERVLTWFTEELVPQNREAEAQRLYEASWEQLDSDQQSNVASNLRTTARRSSPELDAWLVWWGAYDTLQTQQGMQILQQIMGRYGKTPPKENFRVSIAENAR